MVWTAERIKRKIWMNSSVCSGDMLTIDRRYLAYLLEKLEKDQYDIGYHDGYEDSNNVHLDTREMSNDFEGHKREW